VKITFEGEYKDVLEDIQEFLQDSRYLNLPSAWTPTPPPAPPPEVVAKPEKKPELKQLPKVAIDAAERMAKARAAKGKKKAQETKPEPKPEPEPEPAPEPVSFEDVVLEAVEPEPEPEFDPAKLAALRVKTTEDLRAAHSSGKHKQVMALLTQYGNGAKSFRELRIEDFVPIRKAIDDGALA
jgi:outer membrane biosynthesis protein TonB